MNLYIGSYTQDGSPAPNPVGQGIGCFGFDAETGELSINNYIPLRNPSYLTLSEDGKYLYAVEELLPALTPHVFAYKVGMQGELVPINSQQLDGGYACHLAVVKGSLVVANYMSGDCLVFPIQNDGSLAPCQQQIQHHGTSLNQQRQEGPHIHMAYPFDEDGLLLVDLGIDRVKAYQFNSSNRLWKENPELDLVLPGGTGPRHLVSDRRENYLYLLSELSGEVVVFRKSKNCFDLVQQVSIVPADYSGEFGGAAIRIHPNGQFLYASNRGADVIAVFEIIEGNKNRLSLVAFQACGGQTPRDFNIDPSGNWLLVANQDSNKLVVFKIDLKKGGLTKTSEIECGTPTAICWSPH